MEQPAMSDPTQNFVPRDTSTINIEDERECRYWSERCGVTPEQLQEAVHQVGPSAEAVLSYLATPATGRTS